LVIVMEVVEVAVNGLGDDVLHRRFLIKSG
jgi:hypothetical protein